MAHRFVDLEGTHNQGKKPLSQGQELFLDILTKEEKEALLNTKIEGIRKKNEAIQKRHMEIEADKQKADQLLQKDRQRLLSQDESTGGAPHDRRHQRDSRDSWHPKGPHRDDNREHRQDNRDHRQEHRQDNRDHRQDNRDHRRPRGTPGEDNRKSWHGNPAHERSENRKSWHGTPPSDKHASHDNEVDRDRPKGLSPEERKRPGKLSTGRGRRLASMTQEKLKAKDYERRKAPSPQKQPPTPTDPNAPPEDPKYNFLSDRSREGNQAMQSREPKRHPRNYGGSEELSNVAEKIKGDRHRGRGKGPPTSKMEMAMRMTGSERRQYMEWKIERDEIDDARIRRQKTQQGEWKREWDLDKIPQEDGERRGKNVEPGKRPARGVGGGPVNNKGRGRGQGQSTAPLSPTSPTERGDKPEILSRRSRVSSSGSDDRSVEKQNDSLVIKIDNDFAPPKKAFPAKPTGRGRGGKDDREHKDRDKHPQRRTPSPKKNLKKLIINSSKTDSDKDTHVEETLVEPDAEEIKRTVRETPERDLMAHGPAVSKAEGEGFIEDDYISHPNYENEQEWPETDDGANFYGHETGKDEIIVQDDQKDDEETKLQSNIENADLHDEISTNMEDRNMGLEVNDDVAHQDGEEYLGHDEEYEEEEDEFYEAEADEPDNSAELHNISEPDTSAELHNISDTSSNQQEEPSTPKTPLSDIMLKTPTDLVHVLDWGAEMDSASGRSSRTSLSDTSGNKTPGGDSPGSSQNPILKSSCIEEPEHETPTNSREVSEEPVTRVQDDPEILRSPEQLQERADVDVEDVVKSPDIDRDVSPIKIGDNNTQTPPLVDNPDTPKVQELSLEEEMQAAMAQSVEEVPSMVDERTNGDEKLDATVEEEKKVAGIDMEKEGPKESQSSDIIVDETANSDDRENETESQNVEEEVNITDNEIEGPRESQTRNVEKSENLNDKVIPVEEESLNLMDELKAADSGKAETPVSLSDELMAADTVEAKCEETKEHSSEVQGKEESLSDELMAADTLEAKCEETKEQSSEVQGKEEPAIIEVNKEHVDEDKATGSSDKPNKESEEETK